MYSININDKLGRKLRKFSPPEQKKIKKTLDFLAVNPLPGEHDIKKLHAEESNSWRIRIGNLRIIYTFSPENKTVKIIDIGFRGNIY